MAKLLIAAETTKTYTVPFFVKQNHTETKENIEIINETMLMC